MTDGLIGQFGYLGIILLLVLGGLGVPIPEEAPILLAAVLSHKGALWWPLAFAACFLGVLLGDFVVYFLGYFYGEKVLGFRLTRQFLTRQREAQIKGYFHRHGLKILIVGRFAVGFRTAAYLTAGILRLPPLQLLLADLVAATLSTSLMFAGGYWFADWIEAGMKELKHYLVALVGLILIAVVVYRYVKAVKRAGAPVGPPVLISHEDLPLPPDDLTRAAINNEMARVRERAATNGPVPAALQAPAPASSVPPPLAAPNLMPPTSETHEHSIAAGSTRPNS